MPLLNDRCLCICAALALTCGLALGADDPRQMIEKAKGLLGGPKQGEGIKLLTSTIENLSKKIDAEPRNHEAYFQRGLAYYHLRQDTKAMMSIEAAIELSPEVAEYHFYRGQIFQENDRYDDAVHAMEKAVEYDPKQWDYHIGLGKAHWGMDDLKDAIAAFDEIVRQKPDHVDAVYYIGAIHMQQKEYDKAIKRFMRVAEIVPKATDAHYAIGQAYQLMDKSAEALEKFLHVVKLDPSEYRARAKLVQLYTAVGKTKERDQQRQDLIKLRESGKSPRLSKQKHFCCDQFAVGKSKLMAFEHFALEGPRAVKFVFYVLAADTGKIQYRISLGSYDMTNAIAREQKKLKDGKRLYHLDGYFPGGEHSTFGMFNGAPSYDEIKKQVVKIVEGKRGAISGSRPGVVEQKK